MSEMPERDVHPARRVVASFSVRLGAGLLFVNLLVVLMAGLFLHRSRVHYRAQAVATTRNLAKVLEQYVADAISKADQALWAVKDEYKDHAGDSDLNAFILRQHSRLPVLDSLRTANAQGLIDRGVGVVPGSRVSVADRDYFIRLRDDPGAGLVISRPVLGRISGKWVIILARRLDGPDRPFTGVVYGVIAMEQFARTFASLDVGPHGSIAIRDAELGLIARHPEPLKAGTAIGDRTVSRELAMLIQTGVHEANYRTRTPFDRVERTFTLRKVPDHPLYILVGLADQDFLSKWRREATQTAAWVLAFLALTATTSAMLYRAWNRQRRANEAMEKLLAEVKTLGGMLPICSSCKKIRDDRGYWNQIEAYIRDHSDAEFTHGICPECAREFFPEMTEQTPGADGP